MADLQVDENGTVNVEFEFFDPREGDFHTVKRFLAQLFGPDQELLALSALTDMVVGQKLLGTCVKVDGSESDPYAILTVLNLTEHAAQPHVHGLIDYLVDRCRKNQAVVDVLNGARQRQPGGWKDVAFLFNERLINMPVQVVPPMFKMLTEEIQWALDDHEPYQFEWYALLSKTYREVAPTADDDMPDAPLPQGKKKKNKKEPIVYHYHAEDEIVDQFADIKQDFQFSKPPPVADAMRAFQESGIAPARRLYLIRREKMPALMAALEKAICA
ncbi:p21-C-terminal region-binding protein-domain-containing protein [Thamnocephalis sphaerospora]|uniref:Protein BCP1 n=1 Tax=Thamnocephalis sphaerospora TaxID=78915 RepID=A0A4P9XVE0_9FUNG|nr:p21-C-terminal region-binding protein-domain-containing protein [Thamnocephalis sphaerospora]|eukprot:RKP09982.1 p21-C-terminal region-binding protein-domain-containing protein [Thamnocephalis sphaerospora]